MIKYIFILKKIQVQKRQKKYINSTLTKIDNINVQTDLNMNKTYNSISMILK